MKNLTLAEVYELQGLKDEALEIYKDMLNENPNNLDAKRGMKRVRGLREEFSGVDKKMLNFFIDMDTKSEFVEFERWLVGIWT